MPRKPASDWKFFPCQIGDDIAFVYVDVAAGPGHQARRHAGEGTPYLQGTAPQLGLPTSEEFEPVRAIRPEPRRFARRSEIVTWAASPAAGTACSFYSRRAKSKWSESLGRLVHKTGYALALSISQTAGTPAIASFTHSR